MLIKYLYGKTKTKPDLKISEDSDIFTLFQVFLVSRSIKEKKYSYLYLHLLWCIALIKVYMENLSSHKYIFGKRWSNLIAFLDSCGYSLTLYRKSESFNFLKVSCSVES